MFFARLRPAGLGRVSPRRAASWLAVFAALLVPAGALAGWAPVKLISPGPADAGRYDLVVSPNGTATFVWEEPGALKFRRLRADGTRTPVRVLRQNAASAGELGVSARGVVTAAWTRADGLAEARRIAANGSLGPVWILSDSIYAAGSVDVAVAPGGAAVVTWSRFTGTPSTFVVQARRISAGGAVGPILDLATTAASQSDPAVTIDGNGRATVVWVGTSGPTPIVRTRRIESSGTLGAVQDLSVLGASQFFPDVAAGSDGAAVAVWRRSNGTHSIVQGRRIAANGTLGAILDLSEAGQNASGLAKVAMGTNGTATAVWERSNGSHTIVQSRRIPPSGTPGAVQNRSAAGANASDADVAAGPGGKTAVAWRRFNGSFDVIQVARISRTGVVRLSPAVSSPARHSQNPILGLSGIGTLAVGWDTFLAERDALEARVHRPPPPTTRLRGAAINAGARSATFRFAGAGGAGKLAFQCRLAGSAATAAQRRWSACRSPKTYAGLRSGAHTFLVRARDKAGQVDRTPARRSFRF